MVLCKIQKQAWCIQVAPFSNNKENTTKDQVFLLDPSGSMTTLKLFSDISCTTHIQASNQSLFPSWIRYLHPIAWWNYAEELCHSIPSLSPDPNKHKNMLTNHLFPNLSIMSTIKRIFSSSMCKIEDHLKPWVPNHPKILPPAPFHQITNILLLTKLFDKNLLADFSEVL